MGLFDFLKKKKTIENPNLDIIKKLRNDLSISNEFFTVHSDFKELVWIKNGPKKTIYLLLQKKKYINRTVSPLVFR